MPDDARPQRKWMLARDLPAGVVAVGNPARATRSVEP